MTCISRYPILLLYRTRLFQQDVSSGTDGAVTGLPLSQPNGGRDSLSVLTVDVLIIYSSMLSAVLGLECRMALGQQGVTKDS